MTEKDNRNDLPVIRKDIQEFKDKFICGDNVEVLRQFPNDCIDLTVTSPPYDNLRTYNGFEWDFKCVAKELYRVTKPGGVVVWVVGDATINGSETGTSFRQALYFKDEVGFNLHDTMIYAKTGFAKPFPNRYHQVFEYMFVLSKGKLKTFNPIKDRRNRYVGKNTKHNSWREIDGALTSRKGTVVKEMGKRFNIWKYKIGKNLHTKDSSAFKHPAIFPEQLAQDHILSWSNPGDIVLDPMVGSGTTCKMAALNNRNYIGIDISEEYCEIARERIKTHTAQLRLNMLV